MEADVIHDYKDWPEEEVENCKQILKDRDDKEFVEVIRKHKNMGAERAYLSIILYRNTEEKDISVADKFKDMRADEIINEIREKKTVNLNG